MPTQPGNTANPSRTDGTPIRREPVRYDLVETLQTCDTERYSRPSLPKLRRIPGLFIELHAGTAEIVSAAV